MSLDCAYSDLKPAWHLDRIRSLRGTGRCVPAQIQLVISDLCNHDCSFCAYRMSGYTSNANFADENGNNNPNRRIPKEKCFEILSDAHSMGVKAVQFTGGGEPTAHPDHMEIFDYAVNYLGMQCSLVTNGSLLRDGWRDVLLKFSWIRVSLDAGNSSTYSKIRRVRPSSFVKTLKNCEEIGKEMPVGSHFGISFVVTKDNWKEIVPAAKLARSVGAGSVRFAALFTPDLADYYEVGLPTLITQQISEAGYYMNVIDGFTPRWDDLNRGTPDVAKCGYQQFNVYIGGDQNVYRCCNTAYNDLGFVGSLEGQSFAEFLVSPEVHAKYTEFDPRACAHCAFHKKNEVIDYMVSEAPVDVEFV